jgi:hypothetical protein
MRHAELLNDRNHVPFDAGTCGAMELRARSQGLNRRAPGRSRVHAALLPVGQELGLGRVQARRPPARRDAEHGIDVQRDRPEPSQFRFAMPILIQPPHVATILDDDVIRPIAISRGGKSGPTQRQHGGRDSAPPRRRLNPPGQGFFVVAKQPPLQPEPLVPRHHRFDRRPRRGEVPGAPARKAPPKPLHRCEVKAGSGRWSVPFFRSRDRLLHQHRFRSLRKLVVGNLDWIADVHNIGN